MEHSEISTTKIKALQQLIKEGYITEDKPHILMYDESRLIKTIELVQNAFPKHFKHAVSKQFDNGIYFDCASPTEFELCLQLTNDPNRIIYGSPVKTMAEIKTALVKKVYVYLDNFQELTRVKQLIQENEEYSKNQKVGIRINPQVGLGAQAATSTAGFSSKFGVGLLDYRKELVQEFCETPEWLNGVHLHIGSQYCPLELFKKGIEAVCEFVREVNNKVGKQKIKWINIGGGFPVNYQKEEDPKFEEYWKVLSSIEELNNGKYDIFTEFGRALNAKSGTFVSQVEYVKKSGNKNFILQHVGADLLIFTVYMKNNWDLRVSILDKNGNLKPNVDLVEYDIGGPLCFSGDTIATNRMLPKTEQGDYIVIHDAGSYAYSMFSQFNLRLPPQIFSYTTNTEDSSVQLKLIKKQASSAEMINFYSGDKVE